MRKVRKLQAVAGTGGQGTEKQSALVSQREYAEDKSQGASLLPYL